MKEFSPVKTAKGERVYTNEYIQSLRDADRKRGNPLKIIAQKGCQEKFLSSCASITFFGGNRGGGKSHALLMEAMPDIKNKDFNGIILRNEIKDLEGIIETSQKLYSQLGTYASSQTLMLWTFKNGGKLRFSYYSDNLKEFKQRFQGKQYPYIGFDEVTHVSYQKFKYLLTDNRNACGITNRCFCTCNPDPDSWVRKFIDWWIGEDGYPIEERDGVVRYCYMKGENAGNVVWGDTPEEVYEQCKGDIDKLWKPEYEALGFNKVTMFVKSVTFIRGKLEENIKLIASDPNYVANLAQQDDEQVARDLEGNWNFKSAGDDIIKMSDMERFYANLQDTTYRKRFATCDIAFSGGDSLVLWLWEGWHLEDIFVCKCDSKTSLVNVKQKLQEWGVLEKDFAYDKNGIGQIFGGFFKNAIPFVNQAAPIPTVSSEKNSIKAMYSSLKAQCAYLFADKLIHNELSINPRLLDLKFSGDGFKNLPLRDILQKERKCIRRADDSSDKGFVLIKKAVMKKYVGHSPDYFEALIFRIIFELTHKQHKIKGAWMI